ncbi:MAG: hypothetical protein D6723_02025 [Acidobacteria bacterium]|nr:MAG: hypothetical protein D6723_02025 [Acidobacteriota bacterium]
MRQMRGKLRIPASYPPVAAFLQVMLSTGGHFIKFLTAKKFLDNNAECVYYAWQVKGMINIIKATYCGNREELKSRLAVEVYADERCLGRWMPGGIPHGDQEAVKALRGVGGRVRTAGDWTSLMQAVR